MVLSCTCNEISTSVALIVSTESKCNVVLNIPQTFITYGWNGDSPLSQRSAIAKVAIVM